MSLLITDDARCTHDGLSTVRRCPFLHRMGRWVVRLSARYTRSAVAASAAAVKDSSTMKESFSADRSGFVSTPDSSTGIASVAAESAWLRRVLPNCITLGRIGLVPLFLIALVKTRSGWSPWDAGIILGVAGASDYVDG